MHPSCGSWTPWSQSGTLCGTTTSGPSSKFWLFWLWQLCCCCSSTQCQVTLSRSYWVLETLTSTCTDESQSQVLGITQTTVMSSTASVEQAECASCIILCPNTVTGVVHWYEKKLDSFPEEGPLKVTWILHMLLKYDAKPLDVSALYIPAWKFWQNSQYQVLVRIFMYTTSYLQTIVCPLHRVSHEYWHYCRSHKPKPCFIRIRGSWH